MRTLAPHTEADPAALLVTFLALFGNAVGAGPHARVGAARHAARLYPCIVGNTARARKGQSFAEIASIFELADPAWWGAARAGGLASGEGIIARVHDTAGTTPVEKRALFYEPEFSRTLAAAGRETCTLSAVLRDAWDSGDLAVTTRANPLRATGAHVGVVAHVTVDELRARLPNLEIANGFANRFLFVCARRSQLLPSGGSLDDAERCRLGDRVRAALSVARGHAVLRRTPAADALWGEMYCALPDPAGLVGAVTARADAQLLRLSLVYALLDGAYFIDVPHIRAAAAVWDYANTSAAYLFDRPPRDRVAERLLAALREASLGGLSREAQHALFNRNETAETIDAARKQLVQRGLAEERTEPGSGRRPRVLYAVLPLTKERRNERRGSRMTGGAQGAVGWLARRVRALAPRRA